MANEASTRRPSIAARLTSARSALSLGVLVLLVAAAAVAFRDGDSVGEFMQLVLCVSAVLFAVSLVGDVRAGRRPSGHVTRGPLQPPGSAVAEPVRWHDVGRATLAMVVLAGSVIVLGVFAGLAVGTVVVGALFTAMRWKELLRLAALTGVVVPGLFTWALGVRLWRGILPDVLPGWIGGGTLPPL